MQNIINDLHVLSSDFKQGGMISNLIKKEVRHTSAYKKKHFRNDKTSVSLLTKNEFKSTNLNDLNPSKSFNDDLNALELYKVPSHIQDMMNTTRTVNDVNDFTSQNLAVQSKRDMNGRLDNYDTLKAPDRSLNTSQNSSNGSDFEPNYSPSLSDRNKINK